MPGDQTSPELERRKRRGEERGEEEESVSKKKGNSALEKCDKVWWFHHMFINEQNMLYNIMNC